MAKSIYEVLNDLITETSVPAIKDAKGNVTRDNFGDVEHTIPRELLPTAEQFEDRVQLVRWANNNDCLHSCLQKGIQKFLIEIRATFKGMKKDDKWTPSYGQDNVDGMEWKITSRPNVSGAKKVDQARNNDCLAMFGTLAQSGMEKDLIKTSLIAVYGDELVEDIFRTLEK